MEIFPKFHHIKCWRPQGMHESEPFGSQMYARKTLIAFTYFFSNIKHTPPRTMSYTFFKWSCPWRGWMSKNTQKSVSEEIRATNVLNTLQFLSLVVYNTKLLNHTNQEKIICFQTRVMIVTHVRYYHLHLLKTVGFLPFLDGDILFTIFEKNLTTTPRKKLTFFQTCVVMDIWF